MFRHHLPLLVCLSFACSAAAAGSRTELKLSMHLGNVASAITNQTTRDAVWRVSQDDKRLDIALQRWGKQAGFAIQWDADRYLLIEADTTFEGNFEQAVTQLLMSPGIRFSEYPLEACLYENSPPLLRITRLGDQTESCR